MKTFEILFFVVCFVCYVLGALAIGYDIYLDEKKPLIKYRKYKSAFKKNIVGPKASRGKEYESPEYY